MRIGVQAGVRRNAFADRDDRTPLREARAHLEVLGHALGEAVGPSVTFSPGESARSTVPLSTLMPGMMPFFARYWGKGMPSAAFWRAVSSNRITPDTYCSTPGVPKSSPR